MSTIEPQPAVPACKLRWYRLTPERLVMGLLAVEGLLLLSERFRWFAFSEKKGWTVLIALAAVGLAGVCTLLWFAAALLFRWPFQFSIRSLLVLTVAVAIPCSWLATERRQALRQREAYNVLRKFPASMLEYWPATEWRQALRQREAYNVLRKYPGSILQYDFQLVRQPAEPAPEWLREMLGDDFFANVEEVVFIGDHEVTIVELACAGELSGLKRLILNDAGITDAGLANLQRLTQLQELSLCGDTQITDVSLEYLKGMTRLEVLDLRETKVTDAGMAHLQGLTELRYLFLSGGPQIRDASLEYLKGMTQLEHLDLMGTKVTDAGVAELQKALPNCKIER